MRAGMERATAAGLNFNPIEDHTMKTTALAASAIAANSSVRRHQPAALAGPAPVPQYKFRSAPASPRLGRTTARPRTRRAPARRRSMLNPTHGSTCPRAPARKSSAATRPDPASSPDGSDGHDRGFPHRVTGVFEARAPKAIALKAGIGFAPSITRRDRCLPSRASAGSRSTPRTTWAAARPLHYLDSVRALYPVAVQEFGLCRSHRQTASRLSHHLRRKLRPYCSSSASSR